MLQSLAIFKNFNKNIILILFFFKENYYLYKFFLQNKIWIFLINLRI